MSRRALPGGAAALVCLTSALGTRASAAQALPPYGSMNPMVFSRTGLETQPYVAPGRWRVGVLLDYASPIEYVSNPPLFYGMEAELLRLQLTATRGVREQLCGLRGRPPARPGHPPLTALADRGVGHTPHEHRAGRLHARGRVRQRDHHAPERLLEAIPLGGKPGCGLHADPRRSRGPRAHHLPHDLAGGAGAGHRPAPPVHQPDLPLAALSRHRHERARRP